jgi:hypothetical protein
MVHFYYYLEEDLLKINEIRSINRESEKLEKMLLDIKPGEHAQEVKNQVNLALSMCYFKMALFVFVNKNNNAAYHLARVGSVYLQKCHLMPRESTKYPDFIKTQMRYCFLLGIIKEPLDLIESLTIYEIPGSEQEIGLVSDLTGSNHLFAITDALHREGLMDSAMSAYQGFIAVAGFTYPSDTLKKLERLILMTDALSRVAPTHPCHSELQASYKRHLANLENFPLAIHEPNLFMNSEWGYNAFMKLCDNWFLVKVKNPYLFEPSRSFKSVKNISFNNTHIRTESFPSTLIHGGKDIEFKITFTELELVKFVCHLHSLNITLGTTPNSPLFIIDLALQKLGYIDKEFRYAGDEKLTDPKELFLLFQTIKDLAPKYGCILKEDLIKEELNHLYAGMKQVMSATDFFRRFYFEAFHFNTAFYFLYKSMLTPKTDLTLNVNVLEKPYEEAKELVARSFPIHMQVYQLLSSNDPPKNKMATHKTYCENLMQYVIDHEIPLLLQIQVYGADLSHAIYGILEPVFAPDMNDKVIGIQLVISNGGQGCEHHALHKNVLKPGDYGERLPHYWQNTEWKFYTANFPQSSTAIKYRGIKITDLADKTSMQAFCYYLMLCCGGYYLSYQKKICTAESFIEAIYDPSAHPIKSSDWVKPPDLDSLVFFDLDKDMPKQVMGNCTVYNALHAIRYAKNLTQSQIWYLTYRVENGMDELCSSLKVANSPTPNLINPKFQN